MESTRGYASTLRTEQAALTRTRIVDAARRSFSEHGCLGSTLAGIATAAGVSVQTVYNVIGGKAVLLKTVYDITLAGDDEPIPMADRLVNRRAWGWDRFQVWLGTAMADALVGLD